VLTEKDVYVVIKLVSGEQVMAILEQEDEHIVQLCHPMTIRTIPIVGQGREHITAHPFCQFTDDKFFLIEKKNVIFIKRLHHMMIPHYKRIVAEHDNDWKIESNHVREEPMISSEEARKRIAMLVGIAGMEEEEEKEKPIQSTFVEGNETKH
jgi:hypothetical protein